MKMSQEEFSISCENRIEEPLKRNGPLPQNPFQQNVYSKSIGCFEFLFQDSNCCGLKGEAEGCFEKS